MAEPEHESDIDEFTGLFALYVHRNIWCDEIEKITGVLSKEIREKPDFFKPCSPQYAYFEATVKEDFLDMNGRQFSYNSWARNDIEILFKLENLKKALKK